MSSAGPFPITSEQIEAALAEVLSSEAFARSPSLSRFLRFVVEREQAGDRGSLKEASLGHTLFDRPPDYDTKADAVVRVTANRLRQRLEAYYRDAPPAAPGSLQIHLPKGGYIPFYTRCPDPEAALADAAEGSTEGTGGDAEAARTSTFVAAGKVLSDLQPAEPRHPVPATVWQRPRFVSLLTAGLGVLLVFLGFHLAATVGPQPAGTPSLWSASPLPAGNANQEFAALSPDGKTLAFVTFGPESYRKQVVLRSLHADDVVSMFPEEANQVRPSWSPDGTRIAFVRRGAAFQNQVAIFDLGHHHATTLATLQSADVWLCSNPKLSWTRDGRQIVTTAVLSAGEPCSLVAIDVDTRRTRRLTSPPRGTAGDLEPTVSPDGEYVAFYRNTIYRHSDLYRLELASGQLRQVTHDDADLVGVDWSTDGRSLLAFSSRNGERELWRFPLSGDAPMPLTRDASALSLPVVAPAGKPTIYTTRYGSESSIWRDHHGVETEIIDNGSFNRLQDVSEDGQKLLFGNSQSGTWSLWESRADGTGAHRLVASLPCWIDNARWSPDGRKISFLCRHGQVPEIVVMDDDGTHVRVLRAGTGEQQDTLWSRDGQSLLLSATVQGRRQVEEISLKDGSTRQITQGGGSLPQQSIDQHWLFYVVPGADPLLMAAPRDPGSASGWDTAHARRIPFSCPGWAPEMWEAGPNGLSIACATQDRHWKIFRYSQDLRPEPTVLLKYLDWPGTRQGEEFGFLQRGEDLYYTRLSERINIAVLRPDTPPAATP